MDYAQVFLLLRVLVKFQMSLVEYAHNHKNDFCEKKKSRGNKALFCEDMTSD